MRNRTVRWILFGLLLIPTGIGMVALVQRLDQGLILANFTSVLPWGLWISLYIYFIGLSAGSFLLSTLVYVFGVKRYEPVGRMALFQALGCLILGLVLILIDLGRPERFYRTLTNWDASSVLAWEILFYLAYIIILLVELWILLRPDLVPRSKLLQRLHRPRENHSLTQKEKSLVKILAIIGIPVAIGVHGGTGMIFAVVKARPFWHTGLFPLIFLISAMVSGGALLTFLTAFFSKIAQGRRKEIVQSLARLTATVLILDLFVLFIEIVVVLYGDIPHHTHAYHLLLSGPYWWVFWFVQILGGSVIPLAIIFGPRTRDKMVWLGVATLLIFLGVVGVRLNIVIPAQQSMWFDGLPASYHVVRNPSGYFPSLNEWLSSLGIMMLGVWGFWFGRRVLPLESESGITEAQAEDESLVTSGDRNKEQSDT
jgi:Ni/Fe-hydrogenase subunit HybB-like protein